jgi:hypothetical protein
VCCSCLQHALQQCGRHCPPWHHATHARPHVDHSKGCLAAATVALDHQLRQSYVSVALHTGSAVCRVLLLLRPHLYIGLEVHVHLGLQQAREGLQELLVSIRKRVQHLMIKQQQQISQVRKRLQDRERLQDLVVSTAYMTCQAPDQAAAAAFEGFECSTSAHNNASCMPFAGGGGLAADQMHCCSSYVPPCVCSKPRAPSLSTASTQAATPPQVSCGLHCVTLLAPQVPSAIEPFSAAPCATESFLCSPVSFPS